VLQRRLICGVLLVTVVATAAAASSDDLATARKQILPLVQAMQAAANAHDSDKHLSFYAKDPDLLFVINDRSIVGWDALLAQQRVWWKNGTSDVKYTIVGDPDFRMPAPGLVMVTYFLTSERTQPDGTTLRTRVGISALWQRRPEGWRIIYAHESTVSQ
jgi:ketosteroid isomerase-like protein